MLSKAQAKQIRALHRKKERQEQGLFLVEGEKIVAELLASDWKTEGLYATPEFLDAHRELIRNSGAEITACTPEELSKIGTLQTNNAALAVVRSRVLEPASKLSWTLVLDAVNDPGNFGAILRIADWYGMSTVICSEDTVELYNPKTIAASKGSFLRVQVQHTSLRSFFEELDDEVEVFGAYLDGASIHSLEGKVSSRGVILMGSEAHGIARELERYVTRRITIPAFGGAESLNVAVATAVICDNLRRIGMG